MQTADPAISIGPTSLFSLHCEELGRLNAVALPLKLAGDRAQIY